MTTQSEKLGGPFVKLVIKSPIDVVWRTMTDFDSYQKWNSFIINVAKVKEDSKEWDVGEMMALTVAWSDGKRASSVELITVLEAPKILPGLTSREANLSYKFTGWLAFFNLVRAERFQILRELDHETTEYTTQITFSGLFSAYVPVENVSEGFHRQAADLKRRCEDK